MRFVLIHGGFHGAWCWVRLIPELEKRGQAAVAVELPGHGERAGEKATLAGYRDAVLDMIEPGDVLVGHSMGGFVTTVAAAAAIDRVRHVVYLAAGLPHEGQSMSHAGAGRTNGRTAMIDITEDESSMAFRSDEDATAFFYHDCDPALARWACSKLSPQQLGPLLEPVSIPAFWQSGIPRSLILCRQDRATGAGEAGSGRTAARLGADPIWLDTSHSPFLSDPSGCADAILTSLDRPATGPILPA